MCNHQFIYLHFQIDLKLQRARPHLSHSLSILSSWHILDNERINESYWLWAKRLVHDSGWVKWSSATKSRTNHEGNSGLISIYKAASKQNQAWGGQDVLSTCLWLCSLKQARKLHVLPELKKVLFTAGVQKCKSYKEKILDLRVGPSWGLERQESSREMIWFGRLEKYQKLGFSSPL